jgi:hypothetical protein
MYNLDHIKILTKESPGYGKIESATEDIIRSEFKRIFGTIDAIKQ